MARTGRPAKNECQMFEGRKFYRKTSGYYQANDSKGREYMHRAVWMFHHGTIPEETAIHHINGNKADNRIKNLQAMGLSEHARHDVLEHYKKWPERMGRGIRIAQEAAREWHGSKEGLRWHKDHGKRTWIGRRTERYTCIHCGKQYEKLKGVVKRGFCSQACQSAARRRSGVDNVSRSCSICGSSFETNKYCRRSTCSQSCKCEAISRTKRRLQPNS